MNGARQRSLNKSFGGAMAQPEGRAVGSGNHRYRALAQWQQLPAGWNLGEGAGAAVHSRDEVYVFNRGAHPVIVFDDSGNYRFSWGENVCKRAHGIFIDPED